MKTLKEIENLLADRNLSAVAEKTGIKYAALRRIATGKAMLIKAGDQEKLSDYLEGKTNE